MEKLEKHLQFSKFWDTKQGSREQPIDKLLEILP